MCSGFLRRLGALALCAVLLGALGGCGSAARPGGGTGCPLPGDPGDLGDVAEEKSEYTIGETASVGGCRVQLRGYQEVGLRSLFPDIQTNWILATLVVLNDAEQPVRVANFENAENDFLKEIGKTPEDGGEMLRLIHALMEQRINSCPVSERQVSILCDGQETISLAVIRSNWTNPRKTKTRILDQNEMGVIQIWCEVPTTWKNLTLSYSLNGDTVAFELSAMDFIFG